MAFALGLLALTAVVCSHYLQVVESIRGHTVLVERVPEGLVPPPHRFAAAVRRQPRGRCRRSHSPSAAVASTRAHGVTMGVSVGDASAMDDGIKITRVSRTRTKGKLNSRKRTLSTTIPRAKGRGGQIMPPTV